MDLIVTIVIYTTLVASFLPAILILLRKKSNNQKLLLYLLAATISFNAIWYSVLVIEYVQSNLTFNLNSERAVNVISVTFMFLIRFIYLFSFLRLFQQLLDFKLTKGINIALKISGVSLIVIWILGLLEFFILGSHILTSNLLVYTDILIFFIVIGCCIYLIFQSRLLYEKRNQKAIKTLGFIFLIPMIMAFLKWLAGDILEENTLREQVSIPFLVFVLNIAISIWLIVFGNKSGALTMLKKRIGVADELIKKYNISKRELEVIQLICEGYTNKQIADELFISIETVKDHNSRIYLKTEVKNRTQLAKLFLK